MIKTLRITSVIVVVLAAVFIVLPAVFGVRSDEQIEQFLNSAGAVGNFNKARGQKSAKSGSQISPLVRQAEAFALYLNPPAKPKSKAPVTRRSTPRPRPTSPVSAKFTLEGTCYYASRPERSLALIDEPGKGLRWVRQSSKVGYLIIEQVKEGSVVVRDGKRTFELPVERPVKRSLLKGVSFSQTGSQPALPAGIKPSQPIDEESAALMEKLVDELKTMRTGAESDKTGAEYSDEGGTALMEKFISDFRTMRIDNEEAEKLGHLGRELKAVAADSNRPLPATTKAPKRKEKRLRTPGGGKRVSSPEPNSPAEK